MLTGLGFLMSVAQHQHSVHNVDWPFSKKNVERFSKVDMAMQDTLYSTISAYANRNAEFLSFEAMDKLISMNLADTDSIIHFNREQTFILRFFQDGCGVYLVPWDGCVHDQCNKLKDMPIETFRYFKKWYACNKQYISAEFVHFYLLCESLRVIPSDFYANYQEIADAAFSVSYNQKYSFHCMFQWYMQGGDLKNLPPQNVIDICDDYK